MAVFAKAQQEQPKGYSSTIDSKVNIEGDFYTESSLFIGGKLHGEIHSEADVFVGAEGLITGNIFAKNVCIAGTVEGTVETSGFLKISGTGRMYGDIVVFRLITDEGAVFEGKCTMTDLAQPRPPATEPKRIRSTETPMFRKKDFLEENRQGAGFSAIQLEDSSSKE